MYGVARGLRGRVILRQPAPDLARPYTHNGVFGQVGIFRAAEDLHSQSPLLERSGPPFQGRPDNVAQKRLAALAAAERRAVQYLAEMLDDHIRRGLCWQLRLGGSG